MKKNCLILCLLVSSFAFSETPKVAVGLPAIDYLVRAIGGDKLEVTSLLTPSDEPHSFSASPSLLKQLKGSRLFFSCNLRFEREISKRLVELFEGVEVINLEEVIPAHFRQQDPHIWLSIVNLTKMSVLIKDSLIKRFPLHKESYLQNYEKLTKVLNSADQEIASSLLGYKSKTFFVHHPAFGYFALDYGLNQFAVEVEGKSPSPRQLLKLITLAKERNVKLIMVQPQFNQKPATLIAKRIDGVVFSANPMTANPVELLKEAALSVVNAYKEDK